MALKILMISNPASLHTSTWLRELRNRGLQVNNLFISDWIYRGETVPEELYAESLLLKVPGQRGLLSDSIFNFRFGRIIKDIVNRTKLHQSLSFLGKEVAEIFNEGGYDIIHAHDVASSLLLASASHIQPYSGTAWGSDIHLMPDSTPYLKPLMANAFENASFIHVESDRSKKRVQDLAKIPDERIMVSTWGIDTTEFTPGLPFSEVRQKLGLPDKRIILSFRLLAPLYRISTIIQAFANLEQEYDDVILVIGSDGPERRHLKDLVQELGIAHKCYFLGFIDHEDKRVLFSNSYLYVQFPCSDGVAITALEALSTGLPIITSLSEETDVIVKENNGIIVTDGSIEALSTAFRKLISNPVLRNDMGYHSRKLAVEKHDRNRFFDSFIERLQDAI
jgi:glycosyltransferase involved in cell wall biosynthesis